MEATICRNKLQRQLSLGEQITDGDLYPVVVPLPVGGWAESAPPDDHRSDKLSYGVNEALFSH